MSTDTIEGAALVLAKLDLAPSNARRTKPRVPVRVPATHPEPALPIREPHPVPAANDAPPNWYELTTDGMRRWADARALAEPIEWSKPR